MGTAQQRLGTAMNSNKASGYGKKNQEEVVATPTLSTNTTKTEEENFKQMEEEVHRLLETSAELKVQNRMTDGLQKAKEAASKEKKIR
jgi:hypothetical protein